MPIKKEQGREKVRRQRKVREHCSRLAAGLTGSRVAIPRWPENNALPATKGEEAELCASITMVAMLDTGPYFSFSHNLAADGRTKTRSPIMSVIGW